MISGIVPAPVPEDPSSLRHASADDRRAWWAFLVAHPDERLTTLRRLSTQLEQLRATDPAATLALGDWCLDIAALSGDPLQAGFAHRARAWGLQFLTRFEEAAEAYEAAVAAFTAAGEAMESARCRVGEVLVLRYCGRYAQAITIAAEARPVLLAHDRVRDAAVLDMNLASVYRRMGITREAVELSRRAATTFGEIGQEALRATALMNAANALSELDELTAAMEAYQQSAAIYLRVGRPAQAATLYTNLGELYHKIGRLDEGLRTLSRALQTAREAKAEREIAFAHLSLSQLFADLNLLQEAVDHNRHALDYFQAQGMPWEEASTLLEAAELRQRQGKLEESHGLAIAASNRFRAQGNLPYAATAEVLAAATVLHEGRERCIEALSACRAAIAMLREARWRVREGAARLVEGDLRGAVGQPAAAARAYAAAGRIGERFGVPSLALWSSARLGRLLSPSDPAAALQHYTRALTVLEESRTQLSGLEFRQGFVADKVAIFEGLVGAHLATNAPGAVAAAIAAVERGKSRALLDELSRGRQDGRRPDSRLRRIRERLRWYYSRLDQRDLPAAERKRLQQQAADLELRLARAEREHQALAGGQGRAAGRALTAEEIAALLDPEETLLEYFVVGDEVICFALGPEGRTVYRGLASYDRVRNLSEQLHFQMGALAHAPHMPPNLAADLQRSQQQLLFTLYDLLLRPMADRWHGRRVIVVPHGALHGLPFHALWDGTGYVIDRASLSYAPSASVLAVLEPRSDRRIAQPLFVAPEAEDLPAIEREVDTLSRIFPDGTVLRGPAATLAGLRRHAPRADVLHLATHAAFRDDNPTFSSFRMTRSWLLLRDIPALGLSAWLAVLSACETGQVAVHPGEELVGLSHAFFLAGCRSLVASLWPVDDESTAVFMELFYRRLLAGDDVAEALRGAQLAQRDRYSSPFYWAPFIAMGRR